MTEEEWLASTNPEIIYLPNPPLADALEDAGCASTEMLNHCRNGGLHVRGCWVVDLFRDRGK
jgi:hypothetical protein